MIRLGDCREVLQGLEADSLDSCVTDPPYHLTSVVKRFGSATAAPAKSKETGVYARSSAGFMGQTWDGGGVAFEPETWAEVFRVLKPGGYLLAFGGTRTQHRMVCAIEDAGFDIRDQIGWAYGSGFPKSHNLDGDRKGWGTALKPAWEPIVVARKPLIGTVAENVQKYGTGALNIDGCRVHGADVDAPRTRHGGGIKDNHSSFYLPGTKNSIPPGRWPANIIHDGSDEVVALFPDTKSGKPGVMRKGTNDGACYGAESRAPGTPMTGFGDSGSAARFFYCAKAAKADRNDGAANGHPTVKPTELMRYLCRLVTPPGGTVLDPFTGSGSTGRGAALEGFNFVGIEMSEDYLAIANARIAAAEARFLEALCA